MPENRYLIALRRARRLFWVLLVHAHPSLDIVFGCLAEGESWGCSDCVTLGLGFIREKEFLLIIY